MRTLQDMKKELFLLTSTLNRYTQVNKKPMDFGVGVDIYPSEIHTVQRLCESGPMGVTELAELSGVTKGAMSQLVGKLVRKGLVYRETDETNQSKLRIIPTELGEKAQEGHMRFHEEHDKEFLNYIGSLTKEEYAFFTQLCQQMAMWLEKYTV